MLRLPPRSTRTDTLFPYTTLFRSFAGQIDRLAVADDGILMVDYKSNRPPPATAERVAPVYLRQMAAYRALLREIYPGLRSEEHTSELQSLMRISYAVFCLKKKTKQNSNTIKQHNTHTSRKQK